jgi:hypothetical protein
MRLPAFAIWVVRYAFRFATSGFVVVLSAMARIFEIVAVEFVVFVTKASVSVIVNWR